MAVSGEYALTELEEFLSLHKDGLLIWPKGLTPDLAKELLAAGRGERCSGLDALLAVKKILTCPIGGKIFEEPVICLRDGVTYERCAIEASIRLGPDRHNRISPLNQEDIRSCDLAPIPIVSFMAKILRGLEARGALSDSPSSSSTEPAPEEDHPSVPGAFRCPITMSIMRSPVVTPSGHSYERRALITHMEAQGKSPVTRQPLRLQDLRANYALKHAIEELRQRLGEDPATARQRQDLLGDVLAEARRRLQASSAETPAKGTAGKRPTSGLSPRTPAQKRPRRVVSWPQTP